MTTEFAMGQLRKLCARRWFWLVKQKRDLLHTPTAAQKRCRELFLLPARHQARPTQREPARTPALPVGRAQAHTAAVGIRDLGGNPLRTYTLG
ncbi:MAG: hypothetical protein ACP5NF_11520, partial [Thermoanaerobaculum sp.]